MTLTVEQLAMRKSGIGASEAPAICGVVPWRKPMDVYLAKLDLVEPEPETSRMKAGNRLERAILEWGEEELFGPRDARMVLPGDQTLRHPTLPWLFATPDGRVTEEGASLQAVVQVKNVGERMARHWGEAGTDEIPDYVRVQVEVEMEVTGQSDAYVFALLGGHDLRIYPIRRDAELAASILEQCRRFWFDHVQKREPPALDGSDATQRYLAARFPQSSEEVIAATAEIQDLARAYREYCQQRDFAERSANEFKARLQSAIGDKAGIEGAFGRITWKRAKSGPVKWEAVARELGATSELVAKHTQPGSRRFLATWKETDE